MTPSSIVFLVVKLRLSPPSTSAIGEELDADATKQINRNEDKDEEFLASRKEMEDIAPDGAVSGWAHAPYWPGVRYQTDTGSTLTQSFCRNANLLGGLSLPTRNQIALWYLR